LAVSTALATLPAQAYTIFTAQDQNTNSNPDTTPLTSFPMSDGAKANFSSNLGGEGINDLESFDPSSNLVNAPFNLSFSGTLNNPVTSTLVQVNPTSMGENTFVEALPTGTNGSGLYPTSRDNFLSQSLFTHEFSIKFSRTIPAFGFYGVDIGDQGGTLQLQLKRNNRVLDTLAALPIGSTGSVLFYGIIAQSSSEFFDEVVFIPGGSRDDFFALDDFVVGELPPLIPEPSSGLAFLALGICALARKLPNS
jgi:hypothetical protein